MLDMALQNRALRGELKHSYALISQEWAGAGRFLCHAEVKSPLENVILKLRIGWLKQISSFWQKLPGKKVKEYITLGNAPLCLVGFPLNTCRFNFYCRWCLETAIIASFWQYLHLIIFYLNWHLIWWRTPCRFRDTDIYELIQTNK